MRILLATDGSPCSEAAVNEVATRPWPSNSEFKIISAFQIPLSPTPEVWAIQPEYYDEMERAVREQTQKVVDGASARLKKALGQSVIVTGHVLPGSPQSVILEEAEGWKADLIVVGSHGYGTWHRLVLGSVSQAVVLHAKCSVEVVRRSDENKDVPTA
jgi:nucleotide-binding universal stress UspA family protein